MSRRRGALLIGCLLAGSACAASSPLDRRPADAGPGDAGYAVDAGLPACWQLIQALTPGSTAWTVSFVGQVSGPVAADPQGNTYWVAEGVGDPPTGLQVTSIDACGQTRWQSETLAARLGPGDMTASAFVAGTRLMVQTAVVSALDLATGRLAWSSDLVALGRDAGWGYLPEDDSGELGPTAATAGGTLYVAWSSSDGADRVIRVDPEGEVRAFTTTAGGDGPPVSMAIDAVGNIDVLDNSTLEGAYAHSWTPAGQLVFSRAFDCTQSFLGQLASGTDFVLQQSGLCGLTFAGQVSFDENEQADGNIVIDRQDNLYFVREGVLESDTANGSLRWSTPLGAPVWTSLVLGQSEVLVPLLTTDDPSAVAVSAYDRSTGALRWTTPTRFTGTLTFGIFPNGVLLAAPGLLVLGTGQHAIGVAAGLEAVDPADPWPTTLGTNDQRRAAAGQ